MLEGGTAPPTAYERLRARLRLTEAAADRDSAAPAQLRAGGQKEDPEIPANADVAQLVEHFTRNEGVPGSSPGVGSQRPGAWIVTSA